MHDEIQPPDDSDGSDEPIYEEPARQKSITRFVEIPRVFHSVEKDAPFETCISCGTNLLAANHHYVIEKVFRGTEVIVEMAMCLSCRSGEAEDGMSEKSAATLQDFLQEKINFQSRIDMMSTVNDSNSIDPWLERCVLSDQPGSMFREYQVVALCRGNRIQRDFYPALISGAAIEQLSDLLSEETRDWMDDFIGDNFGMPSEFCTPPSTPLLI